MEGHQVQALDPRLERGNAISGAIRFLKETLQADLCPLGSDKGPAAGMAAAALVGSESRLGTGAGQGCAGCRCGRRRMMMATRHAVRGRTHRRSHTVFVCRRHRRRSRQRRERPRKQDQQQQSGNRTAHSFHGREEEGAFDRRFPKSKFAVRPTGAIAIGSPIKHRALWSIAQPQVTWVTRGAVGLKVADFAGKARLAPHDAALEARNCPQDLGLLLVPAA